LNGKVFIYPQTDTTWVAVLHPAKLNVLVSPPARQAGVVGSATDREMDGVTAAVPSSGYLRRCLLGVGIWSAS